MLLPICIKMPSGSLFTVVRRPDIRSISVSLTHCDHFCIVSTYYVFTECFLICLVLHILLIRGDETYLLEREALFLRLFKARLRNRSRFTKTYCVFGINIHVCFIVISLL